MQAAYVGSTAGLLDALKRAIPALAKSLDSSEPDVRESAVRALGYIGSEARSTEPALRRLARNDPKADVRKTAEFAVKAVSGVSKMPPPPSPRE